MNKEDYTILLKMFFVALVFFAGVASLLIWILNNNSEHTISTNHEETNMVDKSNSLKEDNNQDINAQVNTIVPAQAFANETFFEDVYDVPSGIVEIKTEAFRGSNLQTIVLPKSLKKIGSDVFRDCEFLIEINFPDSLKTIIGNPFIGVPKVTIRFDNKSDNNGYFKIDGDYLIDLQDKKIISYLGDDNVINDLPSECTIIGEFAFSHKEFINEIDLANSNICKIEDFAFEKCNGIKRLKFSKTLNEFGLNPFFNVHTAKIENCSNEFFVLENGVLVDKKNRTLIAYLGKSKNVNLNVKNLYNDEESIRTIGQCAFYGCDFIETITTDNIRIDSICCNSGLTEKQIINNKLR